MGPHRNIAFGLAWFFAMLLTTLPVTTRANAMDPAMPPPREETLTPDLQAAVAAIRHIVAQRDADALSSHIRPETLWNFGGDEGIPGFHAAWTASGQLRDFWKALETTLSLAGKQVEMDGYSGYCWPYVFCNPLPVDMDPFDAWVVVHPDVPVYLAPSTDAEVIARLDHAVLTLLPDDSREGEWTHVLLASGQKGYIASTHGRSPIDYRLLILVDEHSGQWWLRYFVAGD